MILQWKMKDLVAMNKRNVNFKIKIVVQANVMTKIVMVVTCEKPKAGVYKIQILKEKVIPSVRVMWSKCKGGNELGNTQFIWNTHFYVNSDMKNLVSSSGFTHFGPPDPLAVKKKKSELSNERHSLIEKTATPFQVRRLPFWSTVEGRESGCIHCLVMMEYVIND